VTVFALCRIWTLPDWGPVIVRPKSRDIIFIKDDIWVHHAIGPTPCYTDYTGQFWQRRRHSTTVKMQKNSRKLNSSTGLTTNEVGQVTSNKKFCLCECAGNSRVHFGWSQNYWR